MATYNQVSAKLNCLMAQYRGTLGFVNSYNASDYTWNEFYTTCNIWNNATYFSWG